MNFSTEVAWIRKRELNMYPILTSGQPLEEQIIEEKRSKGVNWTARLLCEPQFSKKLSYLYGYRIGRNA